MKGIKRLAAGLLAALAASLLSGCSIVGLDVENKLRPPRGTGEQEAIQQALESYIRSAEKSSSYLLKYPKSGDYRSAFIVDDFDRDGEQEAYAFYRPGQENRKTHVNYLRKVEGQWKSVADTEGYGSEIGEVMLGDLSGNGVQELCVGWQQYGTTDREMVLYSLSSSGLAAQDAGAYSVALTADLTASGSDSLLLLDVGAEETVTARLWSMRSGELKELGMTRLDGSIVRFSNLQPVKLADGVAGVYVDGVRESGAMVTELIYWEDGQLFAPFYQPDSNRTTITVRESGIPAMDVDGDGQVEWPVSSRMNGYGDVPVSEALWITRWQTWDYATRTVQTKYFDYVNLRDQYSVRADEVFWQGVTGLYNRDSHILTISTYEGESIDAGIGSVAETGSVVLQLQAVALGESSQAQWGTLVSTSATTAYYAQTGNLPGYDLTLDKLGYMLTILP